MLPSAPVGSYDDRYANALKNSGGDPNNPMFKAWVGQYGPKGTNPTAAPYGAEAGSINRFMTGQAAMPYQVNLPGYENMVGQRSQNTESMLKGEIPDDVISQIAQGAAERGISGGVPKSPNANAAYLRALGLTSLDLMGQGSKELSTSIADTPVPELWNPASLYVPQVQQQQALATTMNAKTRADNDAANAKASAAWNTGRNGTTFSNWFGLGV